MAETLQYKIELTLERIDPDEPEQKPETVAEAIREDVLLRVEFWAGEADGGLDGLTGYRVVGASIAPADVEANSGAGD